MSFGETGVAEEISISHSFRGARCFDGFECNPQIALVGQEALGAEGLVTYELFEGIFVLERNVLAGTGRR